MRSLKSYGFSLLETSISLGIMGGVVMLTFMKITKKQTANEHYVKAKGEIQKEVALLAIALKNPENCRHFLAGTQDPQPNSGESIPEVKIPTKRTHYNQPSVGKSFFTVGERRKSYKVENMVLKKNDDLDQYNVRDFEISFRVKNMDHSRWGSAQADHQSDYIITEKIPLIVSTDSQSNTNTITDCYSPAGEKKLESKRKLCVQLGSIVNWENGECKFQVFECPNNQLPTQRNGITFSDCKPAQEILAPNDLFELDQECLIGSGGISLDASSGKIKVICNP